MTARERARLEAIRDDASRGVPLSAGSGEFLLGLLDRREATVQAIGADARQWVHQWLAGSTPETFDAGARRTCSPSSRAPPRLRAHRLWLRHEHRQNRPDAYFVLAGSRAADALEPANGVTLGPYPDEASAKAAAIAIRGFTLGKIVDLDLGTLDSYAGSIPAAGRHELVRWATVTQTFRFEGSWGPRCIWDFGDAETIYDIEAAA